MKQIKLSDYLAEGERLFGKDKKKWLFECPMCKTVQGYDDFVKAGVDKEKIADYLGFSCIGRFTKTNVCTWSLGGLMQIHELEVMTDDGKAHPRFKFAEVQNES